MRGGRRVWQSERSVPSLQILSIETKQGDGAAVLLLLLLDVGHDRDA